MCASIGRLSGTISPQIVIACSITQHAIKLLFEMLLDESQVIRRTEPLSRCLSGKATNRNLGLVGTCWDCQAVLADRVAGVGSILPCRIPK